MVLWGLRPPISIAFLKNAGEKKVKYSEMNKNWSFLETHRKLFSMTNLDKNRLQNLGLFSRGSGVVPLQHQDRPLIGLKKQIELTKLIGVQGWFRGRSGIDLGLIFILVWDQSVWD